MDIKKILIIVNLNPDPVNNIGLNSTQIRTIMTQIPNLKEEKEEKICLRLSNMCIWFEHFPPNFISSFRNKNNYLQSGFLEMDRAKNSSV